MSKTVKGLDGKKRCAWCEAAPDFLKYHDSEWGFPASDDYRLFEKLSLEGFQSGLSWRTILAKRESFRKAFHGFDFNKVARFTQRDVVRLLKDQGIVRHEGKIKAVINNAKRAQEVVAREGSLAAFLWRFEHTDSLVKWLSNRVDQMIKDKKSKEAELVQLQKRRTEILDESGLRDIQGQVKKALQGFDGLTRVQQRLLLGKAIHQIVVRSDNHIEIKLVGSEGFDSVVTRRNCFLESKVIGGSDGTRTHDLRRDRAFLGILRAIRNASKTHRKPCAFKTLATIRITLHCPALPSGAQGKYTRNTPRKD